MLRLVPGIPRTQGPGARARVGVVRGLPPVGRGERGRELPATAIRDGVDGAGLPAREVQFGVLAGRDQAQRVPSRRLIARGPDQYLRQYPGNRPGCWLKSKLFKGL